MLASLRRNVFWLKDRVKGNVREHYCDIKGKMESGYSEGCAADSLNALLKHACKSVPFYRMRLDASDDFSLNSFPVINKSLIKEFYTQFQSDQFQAHELHSMATSGSTGTPFKILQDRNKRNRVLAELIYFNALAEQKLGERFVFFRVWNEKNKKSYLERLAQNIVCFDILSLSEATLAKAADLLENDGNIKSCLGYASTFEHLCRYVELNRPKFKPKGLRSIVTSSEVMPIEVKRQIGQVIGCSVYDRYSNQENGIISQSDDCSDLLKVNFPSYLVEILKEDSDESANEGEVGRIVVTDLYNYAMPMIRYDTGDLAIKVGNGKFSTNLKSIQGRQVDVIYNARGEPLTPHTWSVYMWKFDKLRQYQFIQEGSGVYKLKVSGAEGLYSRDDFLVVLKPILGNDAKIDVEYVDEIPVLASGKFKKTICKYVPDSPAQ